MLKFVAHAQVAHAQVWGAIIAHIDMRCALAS
jgi:hypothetical protein